jgi:hypothetical protein
LGRAVENSRRAWEIKRQRDGNPSEARKFARDIPRMANQENEASALANCWTIFLVLPKKQG